MRFIYHSNMLDLCNVANQLGLLTDKKAELKMKNHTMKALDCMNRLGILREDIADILNNKES